MSATYFVAVQPRHPPPTKERSLPLCSDGGVRAGLGRLLVGRAREGERGRRHDQGCRHNQLIHLKRERLLRETMICGLGFVGCFWELPCLAWVECVPFRAFTSMEL